MTLSKQLIGIIVVLFFVGFLATSLISVENTRKSLAGELQAHAQETATSLSLLLQPAMATNDIAMMELLVNSVFDNGYFREIRLVSVDKKSLVEKTKPLAIDTVPDWFIHLIPLPSPQGEAFLSSGWTQAGTIYVASHPGFAYEKLWNNTVDTFKLFILSALGSIAIGLAMLRLVLKPLDALVEQANAICKREYPIQDDLPWTRDLRRVVEAMNRLSHKIKSAFDEHSSMTEQLHKEAYGDPVTKMGNRSYFQNHLNQLIKTPEEFAHGALMLLELVDFKGYNQQHGFAKSDELLLKTADIIRTVFQSTPDWQGSRVAGADFAILVPSCPADELSQLAEQLCQQILQLKDLGITDQDNLAHIGIALYRPNQSATELLSAADMALKTAQTKGPNSWHRIDPTSLHQAELMGARGWHAYLEEVIDQEAIELHYQPVKSLALDKTLHHEVLLRIKKEDGTLLNAGVFLPLAEQFNLIEAFDRMTIEKVMQVALQGDPALCYAINLSPNSIRSESFTQWLLEKLRASPALIASLIFEVSENGVVANLPAAERFAKQLNEMNGRFSLDHFGRGFSSFTYLRTLKVDYLKIDGSHIHNIDTNKDQQFFVQALTQTLHGIDILVIAESVESEEERQRLKALGVDGLQGYLVGKPSAKL